MNKQRLIEIAPANWCYTGMDDKYFYFQTGNYEKGFLEMRCIKEDLTKDNLALMARLNITR